MPTAFSFFNLNKKHYTLVRRRIWQASTSHIATQKGLGFYIHEYSMSIGFGIYWPNTAESPPPHSPPPHRKSAPFLNCFQLCERHNHNRYKSRRTGTLKTKIRLTFNLIVYRWMFHETRQTHFLNIHRGNSPPVQEWLPENADKTGPKTR